MENLIVGEILKPHGIRGELKVKPFTDTAETFRSFKRVFIGETEYKILSVRVGDGAVYLYLRSVADRNAAELLRGKQLTVLREEAPALEEGQYYIADLLGARVVTDDGREWGVLTDVRQAATDIYTVTNGDKEVLFPCVKGVVIEVDLEGKTITLDRKRFAEVAVL